MYVYKLHVCKFLMTIKIDQHKFYHYDPLTEMTRSAVKRGNSNYGAIKGMKSILNNNPKS